MNFRNINSQQDTNQMMKLTSIFSIFFSTLIFVAIVITEDKGIVTLKSISSTPVTTSEPSLTAISDVKSKDLTIPSDSSSDESEIAKPSGTSSTVSNYINAWKLSKANLVFQMTI
ncbi:MAG: hypothetical protein L0H55_12540 [Candidatus Nitrosocosmicus sp.]|nr:hypothetical protein [Candidatus Nitrosocosmicus sp.]